MTINIMKDRALLTLTITSPHSYPFVLSVVILLGALNFLLKRVQGAHYWIFFGGWVIAAIVSMILALWEFLGHNPLSLLE
jgi:hypothetical protein